MTSQLPVSQRLLRENAERLAKLEVDFGELGPRRQVHYRCRFPDRERAESFAVKARNANFRTEMGVTQDDSQILLTASVELSPTPCEITVLQELLESFLEDGFPDECSYVDGWAYLPKKQIHFWPGSENRNAVTARADVLFGRDLVEDPLRDSSQGAQDQVGSFQFVPSQFLHRARAMPPQAAQPTASAFAQWVYSIYGRADGSDESVAEGKTAEQDIWDRRRKAVSSIDNRFLQDAGLEWSLVHNGLELRDRARPGYFLIPELRVQGEPLRASPDLMYARSDRSEMMIVEIKFSRQKLPKNLWPNVWAQLWCYAQLEVARRAPTLTAVAEVWGENESRGYPIRGGYEPGKTQVCLRASVRRDPRAMPYDRFFRKLFAIYSGDEARLKVEPTR